MPCVVREESGPGGGEVLGRSLAAGLVKVAGEWVELPAMAGPEGSLRGPSLCPLTLTGCLPSAY